jgi:hypothetical protein
LRGEGLVAEDVELADLDVGGQQPGRVGDAGWGGGGRGVRVADGVAEQGLPAGAVVVRRQAAGIGPACAQVIGELLTDNALYRLRSAQGIIGLMPRVGISATAG